MSFLKMPLKTGLTRSVFALAALPLLLGGCSLSKEKAIEDKMDQLVEQSSSRVVRTVDVPYLGGTAVARDAHAEILSQPVSLRRSGTLEHMCLSLASVLPFQFRVDSALPALSGSKTENEETPKPQWKVFTIQYEGNLRGLLEQLATQSGTNWIYDAGSQSIVFSPYEVKTFTIFAALGNSSYSNTITNKSKDISAGSALGGSASEGSSESQTAQTNQTSFKSNPLLDVQASVKEVLSPYGSVTANPATSTITVRDTVPVMRQVSNLVKDFNIRLSRQVALTVYVWSLELSSETGGGINLSPVIKAGSMAFEGVPLSLGEGGQLSATILEGKGKGSAGILEALYSSGRATLLTSGSGITMSNQALPIQHVRKDVYLASVTKETNDYGQSSTITPGEITHGFAMTVVPQILDRRRLILQYNISLSSLDGMDEFSTDEIKVEMPKVSTKSFAQRVTMRMGQTLVLAGFAQEKNESKGAAGLFNVSGNKKQTRSLIIITIDVESVGEPLMESDFMPASSTLALPSTRGGTA